MSEHLDAIENEIAELWELVLASVGGDEEAAAAVMKANADIALDSNMKRKARAWLDARNTGKKPDA